MKVCVFRAFDDQGHDTTTRCTDELVQRVLPWLGAGEQVQAVDLPAPGATTGWRRYWDEYVRSPRLVPTDTGDVNHVVDPRFADLIRHLPAERTIVSFERAAAMQMPGVDWPTRRAFEQSIASLSRVGAVVCATQAARADLLQYADVPERRVHVVPWGIDESFRPSTDRALARRRLGLPDEIVLVAGDTASHSNGDRIIRAFGQLVTQHGSDATLVKVGAPFMPDHMRLISELELGDRIRMVGHVPSADLPGYYHAADALLHVPLTAGFEWPPLEAMACGTPVVASNSGALPELVGDGAVLVDAHDDTAMADAMADIFTQPQTRRRLVEKGFERAGHFGWAETSRRMVELYRAIAHV